MILVRMIVIQENWRPVLGFEGLYEVSDMGTVRGLDRVLNKGRKWKGAIRKPYTGGRYSAIALNREGRTHQGHVHVLVCEAFHGPRPSSNHHVRHLNGDHKDNRASYASMLTRPDADRECHWTHPTWDEEAMIAHALTHATDHFGVSDTNQESL